MVISVHNNFVSLGIQRNLASSTGNLRTITQRLSTGVRINSAADDAANLDLSTKLDSKTSGLSVANRNINTAMGKLQTFDGHLDSIGHSLQKVRTLAVQAANGVYSSSERAMLNQNSKEILEGVDQATNSANSEIGSTKTVNSSGFIQEVTQLNEAEIAASYNEAHTIRTAQEFVDKITTDLGGSFVLANDIDMSELGTLNLSAIDAIFTGKLDGNGYAVKDLTIDTLNADVDKIGLFSETNGAEIKNLEVSNADIVGLDTKSIAAIVGYGDSSTTIKNCYSSGFVKGHDGVGGIAGRFTNNSICDSCYSKADIDALDYNAGGLIGSNWLNATILNSFATGDIHAAIGAVGGLAGYNDGLVSNSYATGTVRGEGINGGRGGLIGVNQPGGDIKNCYATGDVIAEEDAGGLVGDNGASIINSYATGNVTGTTNVGGFIGNNDENGASIDKCYSTGNVTGNSVVGGFMGLNRNAGNTVSNSFSTGNVSGGDTVGGFIGNNVGTVSTSYTTSNVISGTTTAGFCATNTGTADNTNFYKNNMTTDGAAATTDKTAATASWDTAIWGTSLEEPELLWDQQENSFGIQIGTDSNLASKFDIKHLKLDFNLTGGLSIDISSAKGARSAIEAIDNAINYLSEKRSEVGSGINSLEMVTKNNNERHDKLLGSNSTIKDTDMAIEAANMTKNQILQQSSTSLLQQAQQINSSLILNLL